MKKVMYFFLFIKLSVIRQLFTQLLNKLKYMKIHVFLILINELIKTGIIDLE